MKIDSTDIREFDAKQLSVEFTPPQTTVTVDMFEGALIPSESETYGLLEQYRHIRHVPAKGQALCEC